MATDTTRAQRRLVKDLAHLLDAVQLKNTPLAASADANSPFPLRVPHSYLAAMHPEPDDPLLRQVLPLHAERLDVPGFALDPTGDLAARRVPGLLHKYQGRALIVTTTVCAIHCRYCFRRHYPYTDVPADWRHEVLDYLRADASIEEVILSGGDPLMLSDANVSEWLIQLGELPHLRRIRIHTRVPVVLPERVNDALLESLSHSPVPLVIVIHANHARELTADANSALAKLRQRGIWLFNQAVLLRGVNDDPRVLKALSEALGAAQVVPYYLHQLDAVAGAAHFAVSEAQAQILMHYLRQHLPGYLVPRLVKEVAGAEYKLPL